MIFDADYNNKFCNENNIYSLYEDNRYNDFLYPNNNYKYGYNLKNINFSEKTLFTAGVGMNNVPHLLTVIQLLNVIDLQKRGYDTQIVLGDFDVMLARNSSNANQIAERYKRFLENLGCNIESGTIRTQYNCDEASRNAILLSSYLDYKDFKYVKEDIGDFYSTKEYEHDFATLVSITLMVSDFLTPIISNKYKNVVVCSGIDESKYAILANIVLKRMGKSGEVGGLLTGIVGGLNNHPKMSKSKPDSCILLSDSDDKIASDIFAADCKTEKTVQCKLAQLFLPFEEVKRENIILAYSQNNLTEIKLIEEKLIDKIIWLKKCWSDAGK